MSERRGKRRTEDLGLTPLEDSDQKEYFDEENYSGFQNIENKQKYKWYKVNKDINRELYRVIVK